MYKNDIKRSDSYRFGEYADAPKYESGELPDAFVYMRVTSFAPKSTIEENTPAVKIVGGPSLFVGTVEYIAGRTQMGGDPNYYNLACRIKRPDGDYVYEYFGTAQLRNTYFSGDAKIEVDLQSFNKMKFYDFDSGEEIIALPIEKFNRLIKSDYEVKTLNQESLDLLNSAKTLSTIREYPVDVHICARIEGSNVFLGEVIEPNDNTWVLIDNMNTGNTTVEPLNLRIRWDRVEFMFNTFQLPNWEQDTIDQDTPDIQWTNDGFISGKDEYLSLHGQFDKDGDEIYWWLMPINTKHYIWHVDNTVIDTENTSPEK